jgi:hypothetical protein
MTRYDKDDVTDDLYEQPNDVAMLAVMLNDNPVAGFDVHPSTLRERPEAVRDKLVEQIDTYFEQLAAAQEPDDEPKDIDEVVQP